MSLNTLTNNHLCGPVVILLCHWASRPIVTVRIIILQSHWMIRLTIARPGGLISKSCFLPPIVTFILSSPWKVQSTADYSNSRMIKLPEALTAKGRGEILALKPKRNSSPTHHVEGNNMTSPAQTVAGRGTSNPFIAGGLLKILRVFWMPWSNPTPLTAKDRGKFWLLRPKEILDNSSCWG